MAELNEYCPKLLYIPNPIQIRDYQFVPRVDLSPNLVWLRAFHQIYNPSLGPRVMSQLQRKFPNIQMTMIGPDKGDGSLAETRHVAESLSLGPNFRIVEAIPKAEVPTWLGRADVFFSTTNIDNTPISVIEAMACGLPVVSTNVGGIPYLITEGETGLTVPARDAQAMATAIARLFEEPTLASRLSVGGRRLAETFDWSVVLPQWLRLFKAALQKSVSAPAKR